MSGLIKFVVNNTKYLDLDRAEPDIEDTGGLAQNLRVPWHCPQGVFLHINESYKTIFKCSLYYHFKNRQNMSAVSLLS